MKALIVVVDRAPIWVAVRAPSCVDDRLPKLVAVSEAICVWEKEGAVRLWKTVVDTLASCSGVSPATWVDVRAPSCVVVNVPSVVVVRPANCVAVRPRA